MHVSRPMGGLCLLSLLAWTCQSLAQTPSTPGASVVNTAPSITAPSITLDEAITRARANEPAFAAALAASRVAALDRSIARAALLPSAIYHNQFLYTQPNGATNAAGPTGSQSAPIFIANNAVHEYASQAVVSEIIGLAQINAVSRASAAVAIATAELEISRRGLVSAVVGLFYGVAAADRKVAVATRAAAEAASFTTLTEQREAAREAAHADVVKATLQQQGRDRDRADVTLAAARARLELAVLLFPDPRTTYALSLPAAPALGTHDEVEAAATRLNPELRGATAALRASTLDITAARAAYLPDLALNFAYGIDAVQFAVNGREGVRNLGYSYSATLDIPVWDWLSTERRVRQSQILRDSARVSLTATQRRLTAQLEVFYAEAATARDQIQSLEASVTTATESLHLTRLRYTAGEATVLEVVDAQNSLTAAELAREDGTVRYQIALANLQLLTGTI